MIRVAWIRGFLVSESTELAMEPMNISTYDVRTAITGQ